ncbi:MAG: DedA family protein [Desulfobulbaceae bacterium]|uniref:DedA family protein n=1 Tax=Candidatus Desulfobia pelagia TaxID=2841692 RepID=A0A8J6TCF6_9BACT|nr:DedA family protein [Candidatus Desulfobia pelagia]
MEEFYISQGYPALFVLSFLASTIIPLGSEWLLAALVASGFNPAASVAVATLGNTLGAVTTYAIGVYGSPVLMERVLRVSEESRKKAERFYGRYGLWSLLFSWLPVVGDPLCLVGGVLKIRFILFLLLVFTGKLARYAVISLLAVKISGV